MSSGQRDDSAGTYGFPVARRGYDKAAVDAFAREAHAEITELRRQYEVLAVHYDQLQAEREGTSEAPGESSYAGLGGRTVAQTVDRLPQRACTKM